MGNLPFQSDVRQYYDIKRTLGTGQFSTVKLARRKSDGLYFALKVIRKRELQFKELKYLVSELNILSKLDHPNIVPFHQLFEDKKKVYLVMDPMLGGDLVDAIVTHRRFSEDRAAAVVRDIALALEYCHKNGVVHRDLKPGNILFESNRIDSRVRLCDFGLAKFLDSDAALMRTLCGSPHFIAPEIIKSQPYTSAVDMWGLGATLYVLLVGYRPFNDPSERLLFQAIKEGKYSFTSAHWSTVSAGAKDLVAKLLEVDPAKRLRAEDVLRHPWLVSHTATEQGPLGLVPSSHLGASAVMEEQSLSQSSPRRGSGGGGGGGGVGTGAGGDNYGGGGGAKNSPPAPQSKSPASPNRKVRRPASHASGGSSPSPRSPEVKSNSPPTPRARKSPREQPLVSLLDSQYEESEWLADLEPSLTALSMPEISARLAHVVTLEEQLKEQQKEAMLYRMRAKRLQEKLSSEQKKKRSGSLGRHLSHGSGSTRRTSKTRKRRTSKRTTGTLPTALPSSSRPQRRSRSRRRRSAQGGGNGSGKGGSGGGAAAGGNVAPKGKGVSSQQLRVQATLQTQLESLTALEASMEENPDPELVALVDEIRLRVNRLSRLAKHAGSNSNSPRTNSRRLDNSPKTNSRRMDSKTSQSSSSPSSSARQQRSATARELAAKRKYYLADDLDDSVGSPTSDLSTASPLSSARTDSARSAPSPRVRRRRAASGSRLRKKKEFSRSPARRNNRKVALKPWRLSYLKKKRGSKR